MDEQLMILTEAGILKANGELVKDVPFSGRPVIAGYADAEMVSVVVDGNEVWSREAGAWQQRFADSEGINCVAHDRAGRILLGLADARLAWVADGAASGLPQFDEIPGRTDWDTPWGGPPDVRSLAIGNDGTVYADIHVGWICRSSDGGATWENVRTGLNKDVHQVQTHPSEPSTVFAATADGFHISTDAGTSFRRKTEPMPYYYQRACAAFPGGDTFLASTSRGPHGDASARLYRTTDRGETWTQVSGLPDHIANNINTFQIAVVDRDTAFVVVEDTNLYASSDAGGKWDRVLTKLPTIHALLSSP